MKSLGLAAIAFVQIMLPARGHASVDGDPGPVSSDRLTISVSVAPRYQLRTRGSAASGSAGSLQDISRRYCIDSNLARPARVSLFAGIDASNADMSTQAAGRIPRCDGGLGAADEQHPVSVPVGSRLILVSPE